MTAMRVDVNHKKKIVLIWKSTQEADLPVIDEIEREIAPLRQNKYKIIIMKSGVDDLFEPTLYLLRMNRMKMAQMEVAAERTKENGSEPA